MQHDDRPDELRSAEAPQPKLQRLEQFASDSRERTDERACPWCDSPEITFYQRGLTGPTDERDQYFICDKCDRVTYEIISRSLRDLRIARFQAGDTYRDIENQTRYQITRVLRAGANEVLLYVKPISRRELIAPAED